MKIETYNTFADIPNLTNIGLTNSYVQSLRAQFPACKIKSASSDMQMVEVF